MPKIESSFFGTIIVDGKKYNSDVMISSTGEVSAKEGSHNFSKRDLEEVLMRDPEIVIVGTGTVGNVKIDPAAEVLAKVEGIELIAKTTPQAVEEFNKHSRRRKTVGVFHVTC